MRYYYNIYFYCTTDLVNRHHQVYTVKNKIIDIKVKYEKTYCKKNVLRNNTACLVCTSFLVNIYFYCTIIMHF